MKIIHCLNQYMPLAMAGTETYVQTLALMQKDSGHAVFVVTPHIDYYRPGQINEHYLYEGIDIYQYLESGDPTDRDIHYGNKKPSGLANFKGLIDQLSPDVIHFHELNRSIGLTAAHVTIAKESGAKIFLTVHLSSYTCNTNILVKDGKLCDGTIRKWTCTACSYKTLFNVPTVITPSLTLLSKVGSKAGVTKKIAAGKLATLLKVADGIERIKSELKTLTSTVDQFVLYGRWYKKILTENGVPENKITVVPAALVTTEKTKLYPHKKTVLPLRLVCLGRIQPTKGIHIIIEAMRSFSSDQVQIDFYGRKEDTAYYKKCVANSTGVTTINWKYPLKRQEVVERLSGYDMLCLASTFSEMSPLVIQEAFAAGIPILASKVYGNMEQVTDGYNGMLFEFNSAKSLQEKIGELVNTPQLIDEMKKNIKPPVDFETVNDAYLNLYHSLL